MGSRTEMRKGFLTIRTVWACVYWKGKAHPRHETWWEKGQMRGRRHSWKVTSGRSLRVRLRLSLEGAFEGETSNSQRARKCS